MTTGKAKVTAKRTATTKASAMEKKAAKKSVNTTPEVEAKDPKKKPKVKVVRDFSMPQVEYQKIAEIKEACLKAGLRVKKNEVLRAGVKVLGDMNGAQLKRVLAGLGKNKAARNKP